MNRALALTLLVLAASPVFAQQRASTPGDVALSPIECWWKTDRSAIRVGEHFQLTLTCAVLDTDKVKVVVDESSLAPTALHLVPFEIVSGTRFRDIRNSPRRFFQYAYTMRVLGEDFFSKEIPLPRLQISYRVQNALGGGAALSGREEQYSLRPIAIRVLSVVPKEAADIRDAPPGTFSDVDALLFRSNLLIIVAGVALALAVLLVVVVLVRAAVKQRAAAATRKLVVSPAAVLRAASRELAAVQGATQQDGWNGELAGRAASALRLAGAVALARPVSQRLAARDAIAGEGQLAIRRGLRGKKILLSASVTPNTNGGPAKAGRYLNGASALWPGISQTLGTFSAVRYSRPSTLREPQGRPEPSRGTTGSGRPEPAEGRNGAPDAAALDAALAEGQDLIRRLRRYQLIRFGRPVSTTTETSVQTWAR